MEPVAAAGAVDVADRHGHQLAPMPDVAASRPVDMVLVVPEGAAAGLAAVGDDAAGK